MTERRLQVLYFWARITVLDRAHGGVQSGPLYPSRGPIKPPIRMPDGTGAEGFLYFAPLVEIVELMKEYPVLVGMWIPPERTFDECSELFRTGERVNFLTVTKGEWADCVVLEGDLRHGNSEPWPQLELRAQIESRITPAGSEANHAEA